MVKSYTPVTIYFFSDWCGSCKMIVPVFEELSGEYNGKLKFLMLSKDENPMVA